MSATRDKSQKVAFVYSNLYQLYRKGKEAAQGAEVGGAQAEAQVSPEQKSSGKVLKADDLHQNSFAQLKADAVRVHAYQPVELLGKRIPKPEAIKGAAPAAVPSQAQALDSLKQNLQALNDLHARLRFMLKELEDLVKE